MGCASSAPYNTLEEDDAPSDTRPPAPKPAAPPAPPEPPKPKPVDSAPLTYQEQVNQLFLLIEQLLKANKQTEIDQLPPACHYFIWLAIAQVKQHPEHTTGSLNDAFATACPTVAQLAANQTTVAGWASVPAHTAEAYAEAAQEAALSASLSL